MVGVILTQLSKMRVSTSFRLLVAPFIFACLSIHPHQAVEQQCAGGDSDDQLYCDANGHEPNADNNLRRSHLIPEGDLNHQPSSTSHTCPRVAVVEYSRIDTFDNCREGVNANLDIFDKISRIAHENGVKLLVFPEDGIYLDTARAIEPCLEDIPDPETLDENDNNPCIASSASKTFLATPILSRLSCMAKRYQLYIVANYGTRQQCDSVKANPANMNGTICPNGDRDYLMLNTNVVLDFEGRFIKRYRKWNPYTGSEIFDKAPRLEHTYFDTPYGRFGLFTCFDMIYRDPAVQLVEDYHIDTAVFPTWWFDEEPILTAIKFQDGWSSTNKVNLLSANILKPLRGSTGSSIFSRNHSLYVSQKSGHNSGRVSGTKLLIANIDSRPRASEESQCHGKFDPKVVDIDDNDTEDIYAYSNYKLLKTDTFETLSEIEENKTLCSGEFCCTLEYKLAASTSLQQVGRLILIVRNGQRPGRYNWFEQVCALSVLEKSSLDTAGLVEKVIYDTQSGVSFSRLALRATFDSKYVYPIAARDNSTLIGRHQRRLACDESTQGDEKKYDCRLELVPDTSDSKAVRVGDPEAAIYSFAMYGRLYERDPVR